MRWTASGSRGSAYLQGFAGPSGSGCASDALARLGMFAVGGLLPLATAWADGPAPDPRTSHQAWALPLLWLGAIAVVCGVLMALRRRRLARAGRPAMAGLVPWPRLLVSLGAAPWLAWPLAQIAFDDAFARFAGKGTLAPEFIAGPIWFSAFAAGFVFAFLLVFVLLGLIRPSSRTPT